MKPVLPSETLPPLRQLQPVSTVLVVGFRPATPQAHRSLMNSSALDTVEALHVLLKTLDAALAPVPGLSKHNYGASQHGFCVSAGLTGRCDDHAAAALDAALRLQEAARQVEFPGGQPLHLSIGMASGPLGEGLLGSPGAMQYQVVGRPLAIAQRLSAYGGPNSLRIAAGTWSLLTAAAAGASVKASCWRPTGRLLMGGCSVVDYFAYEPGWRHRKQAASAFAIQQNVVAGFGAATAILHDRPHAQSQAALQPLHQPCQHGLAEPAPVQLSRNRSLERRFRGWYALQQASGDTSLALLCLSLAADRCMLSIQQRSGDGGSALGAALLLLPIVLTCGATVLLQALHPATYVKRRGVLAMFTRFWQTVQLLTLVSRRPLSVRRGTQPARAGVSLVLLALPHGIALAGIAAAFRNFSGSNRGFMLVVMLPAVLMAWMTGAAQLVCCAIVMMAFGVIQGGHASEQFLAGSVCAAAFLRSAGHAEAVWGLLAAATVLVPLGAAKLQEQRSWRQFLAAGAPALEFSLSHLSSGTGIRQSVLKDKSY